MILVLVRFLSFLAGVVVVVVSVIVDVVLVVVVVENLSQVPPSDLASSVLSKQLALRMMHTSARTCRRHAQKGIGSRSGGSRET